MDQYMKIKEFSELTGTSVRTLQYYDEINLLSPAYLNEYGHRFYDAESFSQMFVILSLKNMGMSLSDIRQYLNHNDFDMRLFIQEEKRRIESAITDLQLRLMRLSLLDEQAGEQQDITPYLLPFFSQAAEETNLAKLRTDNAKQSRPNGTFNLNSWNEFIEDLNFCLAHNLSSKDERAIKCVRYWKMSILEANQVSDDRIKYAEEFYRTHPANTFGMTKDNYRYLVELMNEQDENP